MSQFGDELIRALNEALAHAKGDGTAIVKSLTGRKAGLVKDQPAGEGKGQQIKTNELPWQETYRAMAAEKEDWNDFDTTVGDDLDQ